MEHIICSGKSDKVSGWPNVSNYEAPVVSEIFAAVGKTAGWQTSKKSSKSSGQLKANNHQKGQQSREGQQCQGQEGCFNEKKF